MKAWSSMGRSFVRRRTAILIILGLALLGGACGWFLRDQLVKPSSDIGRESTHEQNS